MIERMRECVEYYTTSFMTDNSKSPSMSGGGEEWLMQDFIFL